MDAEQNFFKELCLNILSADKKISFVGIVDADGKLFFGKYRPEYKEKAPHHIKSSFFYSHYLVPTIQKNRNARRGGSKSVNNSKLEEIYFGLTDFCNGTIKLIIIPLEDKNDRYLCVYTFN